MELRFVFQNSVEVRFHATGGNSQNWLQVFISQLWPVLRFGNAHCRKRLFTYICGFKRTIIFFTKSFRCGMLSSESPPKKSLGSTFRKVSFNVKSHCISINSIWQSWGALAQSKENGAVTNLNSFSSVLKSENLLSNSFVSASRCRLYFLFSLRSTATDLSTGKWIKLYVVDSFHNWVHNMFCMETSLTQTLLVDNTVQWNYFPAWIHTAHFVIDLFHQTNILSS